MDVLLNAGGQALPDLQAELALLNTCRFIVKGLIMSALVIVKAAKDNNLISVTITADWQFFS